MKKLKLIFLLGLLIIVNSSSKGQIPTAGAYLTNNTMTAFHGNWRWVSGLDTVKVYFNTKKVFCNVNGGFYWDQLVGWHIYKRGNLIIQNSFLNINNISQGSFFGGNEGYPSNKVWGTLKDFTKNKSGELTLTLNNLQNQILWKLQSSPGVKIQVPNSLPRQKGFTLPQNMILNKL